MSARSKRLTPLTAEQRAARDRAAHDARLATWERLLRAIEAAEAEAEALADAVLDGIDSQEVLEHLADARCRVLGARPRMVKWYGC